MSIWFAHSIYFQLDLNNVYFHQWLIVCDILSFLVRWIGPSVFLIVLFVLSAINGSSGIFFGYIFI